MAEGWTCCCLAVTLDENKNTPVRGFLIGATLQLVWVPSRVNIAYPVVVLTGPSSAGKTAVLNVLVFSSRPADDEAYQQGIQEILRCACG
jgi:hypothetical protein